MFQHLDWLEIEDPKPFALLLSGLCRKKLVHDGPLKK